MGISLTFAAIRRISIIDDNAPARGSYEFTVEDLGREPVQESGPLGDLNTCITNVMGKADAALCDHHLKVNTYSIFNGAELVAGLYKVKFPAVLCTNWTGSADEMRQFRRFIPSLVDAETLDTDSLRYGLESCIKEFNGEFRAVRRPWRTQVRIEDMETEQGHLFINVVVPAWSAKVVRLPASAVPPEVVAKLKPGFRLHANVNLGADNYEELFFEKWE
jgi:hypothetical protein